MEAEITPVRVSQDEIGCNDEKRFQLELEFVQCLANPQYLNWLAQNRYLEKPEFLNYLKYLEYWKKPEYSRFIIYPHALYFLDLLQSKEFRNKIANVAVKELVHTQQFYLWQYYRRNRLRQALEQQEAAAADDSGGAHS